MAKVLIIGDTHCPGMRQGYVDFLQRVADSHDVNDDAVDAVAGSIREFGFRQPIVVDSEGVIIVGHTRWKAAQKLGLEKAPVHVATDLTPDQIKA